MSPSHARLQALLEDASLTLEELARAAAVEPQWVERRVAEGLLPMPPHGEPVRWRFDAVTLRRVRCMVRMERDFDAAPELAALVADLHDEIAALRARLRRAALE
jgi:chaperone modulatory protein CbpM